VELASLAIKISRSENLPVLPQIVSSVMKIADDPNASGRSMEHIIERDPAITAKVLRVANSSYYGVNHVPTIGRAISVLGLNTIRSLVVGVAYQQMISGRAHSARFDKLGFWRHSLAVATGARILAKIKMPLKSEELYGAGMLHDVGLLVMDRFLSEEFDEALKMAQDERIPLHVAEQRIYGFDHAEVGGLLADKWGLPGIISYAVRYHHDVAAADDHQITTMLVAAADHLAHQCGLGNNAPVSDEMPEHLSSALGMPEEQLAVIRKVMFEELMRSQTALNIG